MPNHRTRLRPKAEYGLTVILVTIVAVAVMASVWIGISESRRDSLELLVLQGKALVESLAQAAESAIASEQTIDYLVHLRYHEIISRLSAADLDLVDDERLAQLAVEHQLQAMHLYDSTGALIYSAVQRGPHVAPPAFVSTEVINLLAAPEQQYMLLLDEGQRASEATHYYLELSDDLSRVMVIVADAGYYVEALEQSQIGYLAQSIARESGVEYIVYQSTEGIVFASRRIDNLLAIESDSFLQAAIQVDSTAWRRREFESRQVLELVRPFATTEYPIGVLRVGLSLSGFHSISRGFDRVMVGLGVALFGLMAAVVLYLHARRRRREIRRRFDRMRTVHEAIFEQMTTGVAAVDANGIVTMANAAFEGIAGTTYPIGRMWDAVVPHESLQIKNLRSLPADAREVEVEVRDGGGVRRILAAAATLEADQSELLPLIAVVYDVTRLRGFENEMARRRRLSEMGDLAAGVAHEIRNPLNTISIATQRLAAEFQPQSDLEKYQEITGQIRRETSRLNSIITRFLALARDEQQNSKVVDLERFVGELGEFFRPEAEGLGISLSVEVASGVRVTADPDKLREVFINLFNNAKEVLAGRDGEIAIAVRKSEDVVEILFADTGPGIPSENREEVFKPYFTTKDGGTGLGLPTVHRIVTDLGGAIELQDTEWGGAAFVIRLPSA